MGSEMGSGSRRRTHKDQAQPASIGETAMNNFNEKAAYFTTSRVFHQLLNEDVQLIEQWIGETSQKQDLTPCVFHPFGSLFDWRKQIWSSAGIARKRTSSFWSRMHGNKTWNVLKGGILVHDLWPRVPKFQWKGPETHNWLVSGYKTLSSKNYNPIQKCQGQCHLVISSKLWKIAIKK